MSTPRPALVNSYPKRLAIIGCGSSGLITLKYALDELPGWEITAYEQSASIMGCWGRPPAGFVSTSTKYTTQFACFPLHDASVHRDLSASTPDKRYPDFFCDGEFGDYLEAFANHFGLRPFIRLNTMVLRIERNPDGKWLLHVRRQAAREEQPDPSASPAPPSALPASDEKITCDAIVICTGLADRPKPIAAPVPVLDRLDCCDAIQGKQVVVIGGGESAADFAHRLADPKLNNRVWLSVRSGIRVSPRYHPIRGVPSDFLRNRLLMSFDSGLRNRIGQRFVEFRMRCQRILEWIFPAKKELRGRTTSDAQQVRNQWSWRLTELAKDGLFNMYHNKSDDFLDDVAQGRIAMLGGNCDSSYVRYYKFGTSEVVSIEPDLVVPAIGYESKLTQLTDGKIALKDFYLAIQHVAYEGLYAVGLTRPIIGNIPSISEMQALYIVRRLSGRLSLLSDLCARHQRNRIELEKRFTQLDTVNVYPVEMFPYCDQLAKEMGCYPSLWKLRSPMRYIRAMLSPATTMHYFLERPSPCENAPIYVPSLLTALLLLIKPYDWFVRAWRRLRGS